MQDNVFDRLNFGTGGFANLAKNFTTSTIKLAMNKSFTFADTTLKTLNRTGWNYINKDGTRDHGAFQINKGNFTSINEINTFAKNAARASLILRDFYDDARSLKSWDNAIKMYNSGWDLTKKTTYLNDIQDLIKEKPWLKK